MQTVPPEIREYQVLTGPRTGAQVADTTALLAGTAPYIEQRNTGQPWRLFLAGLRLRVAAHWPAVLASARRPSRPRGR